MVIKIFKFLIVLDQTQGDYSNMRHEKKARESASLRKISIAVESKNYEEVDRNTIRT